MRSRREQAVSSKTASSTSLAPPANPAPAVSEPAKDGEYEIVTWASYVTEERERRPEYKLARHIPHSLQDHMNMLPKEYRSSAVGRQIFEAHIQEAMVGEPDAPAIEFFDNAIGSEVTPPWEFHYTNEMWFGEGVRPPDIKNLESCGCIGRCDPKSSTCACARRQKKWMQGYIDEGIIPPTWPGSPFVYDHKGLSQRLECPVFECNRFCRCDEDCPNRVGACFCVADDDDGDGDWYRWYKMGANGRCILRRRHTRAGVISLFLFHFWHGFADEYVTGVVAGNKKIPKGSYLGIYAGELLTEQEGEARGKYAWGCQ